MGISFIKCLWFVTVLLLLVCFFYALEYRYVSPMYFPFAFMLAFGLYPSYWGVKGV